MSDDILCIEDVLRTKGVYVGVPVGISMKPMLHQQRDTIIITPCTGRLCKYDVPLYKRGDKYLLHRIVEVKEDGYVICGDNCLNKEYDITDEKILGVLTGFYRGDKQINMDGFAYKLYSRLWVAIYPLRRVLMRIRLLIVKVVKRIIGK